MAEKKNRDEISERILSVLEDKPLSIQEMSKEVGSNWSTVNEVLEGLKKEGLVREVVSTEKIKLYQKLSKETYFNIPLADDAKKRFSYLFSLILSKYKEEAKRLPDKTHFAKCAVKVIEHPESKLSDLPLIWYLFGKIPLMIADPVQDYSIDYSPPNHKKIEELVTTIVKEDCKKSSKTLQKEQYQSHNELLYILKQDFEKIITSKNLDEDQNKFKNILNKFFLEAPITEDFPEIFELTERFMIIVEKLSLLKRLESNKIKILLTFNTLWKFLATYKFLDSITSLKPYSDRKKIFEYYLREPLEVRKNSAEEAISELNSIYFSSLDGAEIELPDEAIEVRRIMADWTGEQYGER